MIFAETSGAEDGNAGLLKIETLKAAQEFKEYLYGAFQVGLTTAPPSKE
jgi:hypothetical protein